MRARGLAMRTVPRRMAEIGRIMGMGMITVVTMVVIVVVIAIATVC